MKDRAVKGFRGPCLLRLERLGKKKKREEEGEGEKKGFELFRQLFL